MERVTGIGGVFQRAGRAVADLDAMLAQLRSAGVEVIDAPAESEHGRFGWAVDPEGTRFEMWEPPPVR